MPWIEVTPFIDYSVRGLCVSPYYNHLRGCPNFGKRKKCPPQAPRIEDVLDLSQKVFAIYNVFDFEAHVKKMKDKHSEWSQRQLECCLYWQPTARKALKQEVKEFLADHRDLKFVDCPEAQGVNLTATMGNVGIDLEWPPVSRTYQIILAGRRLDDG